MAKRRLETASKEKFFLVVANNNPESIYLEKSPSLDIKTDGNLASVCNL
ncbi:MAG: hypothetical protein ACJAYY_000005 [Paraglaciecola sp.]|jgi:hypothetical protein